jgi:hypothetical protein
MPATNVESRRGQSAWDAFIHYLPIKSDSGHSGLGFIVLVAFGLDGHGSRQWKLSHRANAAVALDRAIRCASYACGENKSDRQGNGQSLLPSRAADHSSLAVAERLEDVLQ